MRLGTACLEVTADLTCSDPGPSTDAEFTPYYFPGSMLMLGRVRDALPAFVMAVTGHR